MWTVFIRQNIENLDYGLTLFLIIDRVSVAACKTVNLQRLRNLNAKIMYNS